MLTSTGGHSAACQTSRGRPCQQGTVAGGQGAPPVTVAGVVRQATAIAAAETAQEKPSNSLFWDIGMC